MFTFLLAFSFLNLASAETPQVKIDSFYYTGNTTEILTAEVCGRVIPAPAALSHVTVTADPRSKNPAQYTVVANHAGKFCTVVMTLTGTATAELAGAMNPTTFVVRAESKSSR